MPRELRLNVRDLVLSPENQPEDDWRMPAHERARLGSQAHARYFAERPGQYRTEVWLAETFNWNDWTVTLQGRLDGMRETTTGLVVEEIKSTRLGGAELEELLADRAHREQCGFYCLLLERAGRAVERGLVVYVALEDGAIRAIDIEYERSEYERLLHDRLVTISAGMVAEESRAARRRELARRLRFPFRRARASQGIMERDVATAAAQGLDLLVSAPTGTGKTAAALLPMARRALAENGRLFFVTSRVSQQELALDTLRALVGQDTAGSGETVDGLAMQLRAKERSCPMEVMRCIAGVCPYLTEFSRKLEATGIVDELAARGVVDADVITETALEAMVCPFELSLVLARRCVVFVGDYNYVFDPRAAPGMFLEGARRKYLIVDEAHNLPERARGYFSPEIDFNQFKSLATLCQDIGRAALGFVRPERAVLVRIAALLERVRDEFERELRVFEEESGPSPLYARRPDREIFENAEAELEALLPEYYAFLATDRLEAAAPLRSPRGKRNRDELLEALFNLREFCRVLRHDPGRFAFLWRPEGRLGAVCLDAAEFLRERFQLFSATLCMSATLSPFEFHAPLLGLGDALRLELPSPFSPARRLFLAVGHVDTTMKQRDEFAEEIAATIVATATLRAGNYLAFFSSFAYLQRVADVLPPGDYRVIRQQPAMPTELTLRLLRENETGTVLLFAVHGGVFAEGVDFPGHLALGAFVVGAGLPLYSAEREFMREYYDHQGLNGFDFAYLHPGINRSVQAGGRVIRSETDRGFVLLIGRQFTDPRYQAMLPGFWREELRVAISREEALEAVRAFWARTGRDGQDEGVGS